MNWESHTFYEVSLSIKQEMFHRGEASILQDTSYIQFHAVTRNFFHIEIF